MLKERLLVVMQEQQAAEVAQIRGDIVEASWGQQIRNYVMHPYKMVKVRRRARAQPAATAAALNATRRLAAPAAARAACGRGLRILPVTETCDDACAQRSKPLNLTLQPCPSTGSGDTAAVHSRSSTHTRVPWQDTRTAAETAQVQDVMDGDLDMFIESYLRWRTSEVGAAAAGAGGNDA
jgi:hypothetical protein